MKFARAKLNQQQSSEEKLHRSYKIKDKIISSIIPIAAPTVAVPISLITAWSIHIGQALRLNLKHRRYNKKTPDTIPKHAGGENRSQDEVMSKLPLNDYRPLPLDGYTMTGIRAIPDIAPMYFDTGTILRGRLHRYPRHFHETLIPIGSGDTLLSAVVGLHHAKLPRPGILIVHGLMNSKRHDLVRVVSMRAFYEWGFNVCAVDLRGFGRSAESISTPSSGGGMEARDLLEVVKYLKQFPHFTSIGLLGFSLGAGTVINAAAFASAENLVDGGVMAISPPLNFLAAINRVDNPPEDHEHLLTYHFFQYLMKRFLKHAEVMRWARKQLHKEGGDPKIETFYSYLRNVVAWGYLGYGKRQDRDQDELLALLLRLNSPIRALKRVKIPTLILQAKDDPITRITKEEIQYLEEVSKTSKFLRYHITEKGGHTAYALADPKWFYSMIRIYFTYWGNWVKRKRHPFENVKKTNYSKI